MPVPSIKILKRVSKLVGGSGSSSPTSPAGSGSGSGSSTAKNSTNSGSGNSKKNGSGSGGRRAAVEEQPCDQEPAAHEPEPELAVSDVLVEEPADMDEDDEQRSQAQTAGRRQLPVLDVSELTLSGESAEPQQHLARGSLSPKRSRASDKTVTPGGHHSSLALAKPNFSLTPATPTTGEPEDPGPATSGSSSAAIPGSSKPKNQEIKTSPLSSTHPTSSRMDGNASHSVNNDDDTNAQGDKSAAGTVPGVAASSVEVSNSGQDSSEGSRSHPIFPKRGLLMRLPSQAIADSPTSETASTPALSRVNTPANDPPPYTGSSGSVSSNRPNDYRFPFVPPLKAPDLSGPGDVITEEENVTSTLSTSPAESPLFSAHRSLSPSAIGSPRRHTNRQLSSSSIASSNHSISEYSTAAGFIQHRRHSSRDAPRQVKETYNAQARDLPDGKRKLNQYILERDIGRGSFGIVQIAKDEETGKEYAVKEFSKARLRKRQQSEMIRRQGRGGRRGAVPIRRGSGQSGRTRSGSEAGRRDLELIRSEIAIMKKLDHPNVVKLYEVLDVQEDDSLFMVVELCANGPIMQVAMGEHAEPVNEEDARNYFRQIVLAIEYLHYNGIIHRDIKPENILRMSDANIVKLVDFGVSEMFDKAEVDAPKDSRATGSPAFMSPELCIGHGVKISGKAADIWALGVTLYCLVVGHLPFESSQMLDLYDRIKNDPVRIPKELSPELKDLLAKLLEKDPEQRIKMPELRDHPWVTLDGRDPLPSTDVNVSSLPDITEQDVQEAISVPSVSYIVNAVRAASRWKRLAARRTMSEGHDSISSSLASSDLSRTQSTQSGERQPSLTETKSRDAVSQSFGDLTSSPLQKTASTSSRAGTPATSRVHHDTGTASPIPGAGAEPALKAAMSFPQSATKNEKAPLGQPHSVVEFPNITSTQSHHDHLSMGIDDCNVETLRYYEDQTGDTFPRPHLVSFATGARARQSPEKDK